MRSIGSDRKSWRQRPKGAVDLVIVFTDHQGRPILPDLDAARSRFRQSEARLRPTANELTFTFNSPDYPWSAAELTDLQTQLGNYYPTAKGVYGSPAFNITVNLAKDPTISYAGLYFASTNEMIVQSNTRQDAICHEMIHAFRDDDIILLNSYEEGMTRAAEIEVFDRLPNYTHPWDENHSYLLDIYYEGMNQPEIGSRDGNFFQTYPNTLSFDRYQLAGYAWCKELLENPQFFVMFNQRYYSAILSDYSIQFTESKLLDLVESVQSGTEGMGLRTWYSKQAVFNASPPAGYFLYQRINQGIYLYRDPSGAETMQANATINWAVYDYQDLLFDSGSGVTGVYGWISFSPNIPGSYTGRLKVVTTTMSPAGMVSNVAFRPAGNETGVFGVVLEANSGTVTITSLDSAISPVNANVTNGSFSAPSLTSARGRFRAAFIPTSGPSFFKFFNKDASDYFLLLTPPDLLQLATAVSRQTHGLVGTFDIDLPLNGSPG